MEVNEGLWTTCDAQTDVMSNGEIRTSAKENFVAWYLTCNTTGSLEYTDILGNQRRSSRSHFKLHWKFTRLEFAPALQSVNYNEDSFSQYFWSPSWYRVYYTWQFML